MNFSNFPHIFKISHETFIYIHIMVGVGVWASITWEASWKPLGGVSGWITDNYKGFPWQASGRKCHGGRCSQGLRTPWWVVLSHITAFLALRLHLLVSFSEALGRGLLQMPLKEGRRGNLKDTPSHPQSRFHKTAGVFCSGPFNREMTLTSV